MFCSFALAAAILVFAGWEAHRSTVQVAAAADERKNSSQILAIVDDTEGRLVDAETAERGYLITGDESYLQPHREAIRNLDEVLTRLKGRTASQKSQQKHIQVLEPLIEKKLARIQESISLRRGKGLAAATQLVREGGGKLWMDEIRAVIAEMQAEEKGRWLLHDQEMREALARSAWTIFLGNLAGLALLGVVFAFLTYELGERRRTQKELEKREKWFSTTLGSVGDAVIATDMNGTVNFLNSVAESLTGWSLAEARGKSMDLVFDIMNAETRQPAENPVKKVLREGKVVGLADHTRLRRRDGREFDIEDSAAPILTDAGEGLGMVLVFRDITEQRRIEAEIQRSEALNRAVLESAVDGIIVIDEAGSIQSLNPAAEQTFGWKAEEVIGQNINMLMPAPYQAAHDGYLRNYVETGEKKIIGIGREVEGLRKDGTRFPIHLGVTEMRVGGRRLFVGITRDITTQKRAEEAILRAKEEAERGSKFKDQFLSTMSHELRTPLNAVLGFSDLLADERYGSLNARQQRYVNHIHTGGKHLLKLISDILDLSKIEAGRMELLREDVAVASACAEVLGVLQPLAGKKSQALLKQVEPSLYVRADAMRFKQILMNLLGNAIKFTPEGGRIELIARRMREQVRVEVRDNGPGIPPEQRQRIFEAFYRLAQTGNATEGTGLGLAITVRLVVLHGSKLEIESKPGEGTCFHFSLPLVAIAPDEPAQTTIATPRAGKTLRILVVEDDAVAGQLIQSQLSSSGYETLRCSQPERAAEMAAELQPDAITLDLVMQPVHGLEVLRQLKNDPRTSKIPVIVVTIVDQPGVGTALGDDEYLIKPVDKATLLAAVERCLRSHGGTAPARPILVVEEDASTCEMIKELLTAGGYSVITAADGAEARARVAHALPELIILDLVLPKMSGFELLAEWRGSPRTADLPVFVLTSKDLTQEEEKYVRAHAESLFRKQHSWREPLMKQLERVVASQIPEDA